jgi:hypothetical protein
MLSEGQIRQALHASRVVPLAVAKPHGPLGLEQLAGAMSHVNPAFGSGSRVCAGRSPLTMRLGKS